MKILLGKKGTATDEQFRHVWDNIGEYVTESEYRAFERLTVTKMKMTFDKYAGKGPVVYAWSGGKDSIALQALMEKVSGPQTANHFPCVLGTISPVEWPAYLKWVSHNSPAKLVTFDNTALTPEVIKSNHPDMLFPKDAQVGYQWTLAGTRRAQLMACDHFKPSLMVMGRRKIDGNAVPSDISSAKNFSCDQYFPIRDWSHELVIAACRYNGLTLPPTYDYPHGWTCGTGSWAGRRIPGCKNDVESFMATAQCDPSVVEAVRNIFPDANLALCRLAADGLAVEAPKIASAGPDSGASLSATGP